MGIEVFKKHLREKRAIKVSVGYENLSSDKAAKICRAAQASKVSAIDIPSDKEIYNIARKNTKLPIFVSSIHPFEILNAAKFGADAIQIGNFYQAYKNGHKFNSDEIYNIILESLGVIRDYDIYTCVTIPACISLDEQINLIKKLELLSVDLLQTEGYAKSPVSAKHMIESAELSIKNMSAINKHSRLPIMASCAMDMKFAKFALENGASAVAIDRIINKLDNEAAMTAEALKIVGSIAYRNSIYREIVKSPRELKII